MRPRTALLAGSAAVRYMYPVPRIEFEANRAGQAKAVDVPDGGDLLDICDDVLAPVPFSCRSASCATCEVRVIEGAECFEPPNDDEADLLRILGDKHNHRIACQARLKPGPGLVRLRAVAIGPPVEGA